MALHNRQGLREPLSPTEWVIRGETVETSLFIMTGETGLVGKGCVVVHPGGSAVLDQGSSSG